MLRVDIDRNGNIKHDFGDKLIYSSDDKEKAIKCQGIINTHLALLNAKITQKSTDKFRRIPEILNISILMSAIYYGQQDSLESHVRLIPHCPSDKITNDIERDNQREKIKDDFKKIIESRRDGQRLLLVPYPLIGDRNGRHMILAVVEFSDNPTKQKHKIAFFDSNTHSEVGQIEIKDGILINNQYIQAREEIQINGFTNIGLLNSNEKVKGSGKEAFKPQNEFSDCTYWVEATILVLSEIISEAEKQNKPIQKQEEKITKEEIQKIDLEWLSNKLQEKEIQDKIRVKHDEILATNGNIVQQ